MVPFAKRGILHIPDAQMLANRSIDHWIDRFQEQTRRTPTEIVLPGITYHGPTFDSQVHKFPAILKHGNLFPNWVEQCRKKLGQEVKIWFNVIPSLSFVGLENMMIFDQYGNSVNRQACLANPLVQKILNTIIYEACEFGIGGVVLDATDIYPNASAEGLIGPSNTCFCSYCLDQLRLNGWVDRQLPFIGARRNITRFVLLQTSTGTSHIDAKAQWLRDTDVEALLEVAVANKYVDDDTTDRDDAELLLRYLAARGRVTAGAIRQISAQTIDRDLAFACILGDDKFDMSQGTCLSLLVEKEACSQYWLPWISDGDIGAANGKLIQYLAVRASYVTNWFFEFVGDADRNIAGGDVKAFLETLYRRVRLLSGNRLTQGAVFAVEHNDEYAGFAGVPLVRDDIVDIVQTLSAGSLGQVLPQDVINGILHQVRLTYPVQPS